MKLLQALEARAHDLEQDVLVRDARARTLNESLQLQEAEALRLQQQLAEATREVAAARTRVADAERRAHDAQEAASRQTADVKAQGGAQRSQLLQRVARAETVQNVRCMHVPFGFHKL
jgi:hypothetical protein